VTKNVKAGEVFTEDNIRSVRPADGLHTKYYEQILGKRASRDIEAAEPLAWEMIQKHE
jgi:sialic acid synthase SpsE